MDFSVASRPIPIFSPNYGRTSFIATSPLVSPKVARLNAFIDCDNSTEVNENVNDDINRHEIPSDDHDDGYGDHEDSDKDRNGEDHDDENCGSRSSNSNLSTLSSSPQSSEMPDIPDDPSDNPSAPSSPPRIDAKRFRSIYMNCIARFHLQKEIYNSEIEEESLMLSSSPSSS